MPLRNAGACRRATTLGRSYGKEVPHPGMPLSLLLAAAVGRHEFGCGRVCSDRGGNRDVKHRDVVPDGTLSPSLAMHAVETVRINHLRAYSFAIDCIVL